jgi:hypothetical protein
VVCGCLTYCSSLQRCLQNDSNVKMYYQKMAVIHICWSITPLQLSHHACVDTDYQFCWPGTPLAVLIMKSQSGGSKIRWDHSSQWYKGRYMYDKFPGCHVSYLYQYTRNNLSITKRIFDKPNLANKRLHFVFTKFDSHWPYKNWLIGEQNICFKCRLQEKTDFGHSYPSLFCLFLSGVGIDTQSPTEGR